MARQYKRDKNGQFAGGNSPQPQPKAAVQRKAEAAKRTAGNTAPRPAARRISRKTKIAVGTSVALASIELGARSRSRGTYKGAFTKYGPGKSNFYIASTGRAARTPLTRAATRAVNPLTGALTRRSNGRATKSTGPIRVVRIPAQRR